MYVVKKESAEEIVEMDLHDKLRIDNMHIGALLKKFQEKQVEAELVLLLQCLVRSKRDEKMRKKSLQIWDRTVSQNKPKVGRST